MVIGWLVVEGPDSDLSDDCCGHVDLMEIVLSDEGCVQEIMVLGVFRRLSYDDW